MLLFESQYKGSRSKYLLFYQSFFSKLLIYYFIKAYLKGAPFNFMLLMFFLRIKNNTKLAGDVETTNFSIKLFICKHLGGSFLTFLSLLKGKNTTNFLVIHFKSTLFRIKFQLNLNLPIKHYGGKYF